MTAANSPAATAAPTPAAGAPVILAAPAADPDSDAELPELPEVVVIPCAVLPDSVSVGFVMPESVVPDSVALGSVMPLAMLLDVDEPISEPEPELEAESEEDMDEDMVSDEDESVEEPDDEPESLEAPDVKEPTAEVKVLKIEVASLIMVGVSRRAATILWTTTTGLSEARTVDEVATRAAMRREFPCMFLQVADRFLEYCVDFFWTSACVPVKRFREIFDFPH